MRRIIAVFLGLALFLCLAGCKDKTKTSRPDMDALKSAKVGSYIFFGEYEQDNDESTGKEAIEWLVLDKQEDKMLVISRYGLDCQPYNTEWAEVTWETCTLRSWLNSTFYETTFIPEEKSEILSSVVAAETNPYFVTPAGNDTTDKVFQLSIDEANRYFAHDARACQGMPYCYAQGTYEFCNGNGDWWLRSPGANSYCAVSVYDDGGLDYYGYGVFNDDNAVRPAMWIDLKP